MSSNRGMTCENVTIKGDKGTPITAYAARPLVMAPFRASCLSTISGLERVLHRDDASVRASRPSRDLRQPIRARGWRQRRQP